METIPLEEFDYERIYRLLTLIDEDFVDFDKVVTGPVTYYNFTVYGTHDVPYSKDLIAHVKAGYHSIILDTHTDEWVAYQGPTV